MSELIHKVPNQVEVGNDTQALLEQRLKRAELLLELSRKLAGVESLDEVLEHVIEVIVGNADAARATIFLNDSDTNELYSRYAQGVYRREIRLLNHTGIAGHVFTHGESLIINNPYDDARFNREIDSQTGFTTESIIAVPIRTYRGEVIGVAQALNKTSGEFAEVDMQLLTDIVNQASIALQSTLYVERMCNSREQELKFLDIVADVTSEIDINALLQKVMGEATRMLDAERSTLFLNNEKTNELWSIVGGGLNAVQISLPNTSGIAGAVFTSGETINIPHAYADLRFNPSFDKKTGFFTRAILCVPVVNKNGKTIGVTQVLNKRSGPFSDEDESRLRAFTAQVSIALENAKLFDDVQSMKNYNDSMLQSMSNGVVTLDEEGRVVTCNAAGLAIMHIKEEDIVGQLAADFFCAPNDWILEKLKHVNDGGDAQIFVDVELACGDEQSSVNISVQPLVSGEEKSLGSMLMIEDISTEKRMKSTMSRYMDPTLADQLLGDGEDILGGKSVTATVLFSDVRGFTTLTEALGAQGTVSLLNEYFTIMVECIQREGGMLDKFIGDAIMAAFGMPVSQGDDEDRAVRASIAMIRDLDAWNVERLAQGKVPVDMGIGLNTDTVVSGNIGSPKRMDFTMIGDGVNLAARLESACKQYHARILISEHTYQRLRGTYRARSIDHVVVKGKTEPVEVYEVLDYHTEQSFPNMSDVLVNFRDGRGFYRNGDWGSAIEAFERALALNPQDHLSRVYVDRCTKLREHPLPEDWQGVWVMDSK